MTLQHDNKSSGASAVAGPGSGLMAETTPAHGLTDREALLAYRDALIAATSISDLLDEMSGLALAVCNHGGYENGDGGHGVLRLDLRTGAVTLEHHDYYLESVRSFHDLTEVENTNSSIDAPDAVENGIQERAVSFGGCGGVGDGC